MIAQRVSPASLAGFLTKKLNVPEGYVGVVYNATTPNVFPSGQHIIYGVRERLLGRISNRSILLLPTRSFALNIPLPRLQAGDGQWIDLSLALQAHVSSPVEAATALADEEQLVTDLSSGLDAASRSAVEQWAAQDLSHANATEALRQQLRAAVAGQLRDHGLELDSIVAVTARPSDEAVRIAEQLAAVDAAMAEVEMGRQMDALTSQAEWLQFAQQVEADFDLPQGALVDMLEAMGDSATAAQVRRAVATAAGSDDPSIAVRIRRLGGEVKAPPPPAPLWWEPYIVWLKLGGAIVLLLGLLGLAGAPFVPDLSNTTAVIVLILSALIAGGLIGCGLWLDTLAATRRGSVKPPSLLERMGHGERRRMDQLVRDQLSRELNTLSARLREAQNLAYREGYREEALSLRDVAEDADRARRAIQSETHGPAAYLTRAQVTREQLSAMLRYDEELLARSATLGDMAEDVRQAILTQDGAATDHVQALRTALSALSHQINARARFIQAPTN